MSSSNEFSVAEHWTGGFDEKGLQDWAENLRGRLSAPRFGPDRRELLDLAD